MSVELFDSNLILTLLGAVVAVFGVILVFHAVSSWFRGGSKISTRMEQFVTLEDETNGSSAQRQIIQREISGSLFNRTIHRWINNLLLFFGKFAPKKMVDEIEHKLTIAGHPAKLRAGDVYAIKFLLVAAAILFTLLINRDFNNLSTTNLMMGLASIGVCLMLPDFWLNGQMRTRQDEIQRGLPDALDMLSVCASAGLSFDQSLQKISSYWDNDLGRELKIVTQEMEMGVARTDALRNLGKRLEVDDLTRFVAIIIQAELIGMSYADVLHSQASQLRILRGLRAREIANKLPGKMIFPLAILIFPAMIAVILGPSIPLLLNMF